MKKTLAAIVLALVPSLALAQSCPTRVSWPTTDWPKSPVSPTAKAGELKALEDFAFTLVGKENERKGFQIGRAHV